MIFFHFANLYFEINALLEIDVVLPRDYGKIAREARVSAIHIVRLTQRVVH